MVELSWLSPPGIDRWTTGYRTVVSAPRGSIHFNDESGETSDVVCGQPASRWLLADRLWAVTLWERTLVQNERMVQRPMREDEEWLVRVFVDNAESPVWYRGPCDYSQMHLSPELERDLRKFSDRYYEVVEPRDGYAVRGDIRHSYEREGERLAQALALEVGQPFSVSVIHPTRGSGSRTYRSSSAPTNLEAQAAFVMLHDESS
jgi:hypothetical protein